jgi:hypothetical protein
MHPSGLPSSSSSSSITNPIGDNDSIESQNQKKLNELNESISLKNSISSLPPIPTVPLPIQNDPKLDLGNNSVAINDRIEISILPAGPHTTVLSTIIPPPYLITISPQATIFKLQNMLFELISPKIPLPIDAYMLLRDGLPLTNPQAFVGSVVFNGGYLTLDLNENHLLLLQQALGLNKSGGNMLLENLGNMGNMGSMGSMGQNLHNLNTLQNLQNLNNQNNNFNQNLMGQNNFMNNNNLLDFNRNLYQQSGTNNSFLSPQSAGFPFMSDLQGNPSLQNLALSFGTHLGIGSPTGQSGQGLFTNQNMLMNNGSGLGHNNNNNNNNNNQQNNNNNNSPANSSNAASSSASNINANAVPFTPVPTVNSSPSNNNNQNNHDNKNNNTNNNNNGKNNRNNNNNNNNNNTSNNNNNNTNSNNRNNSTKLTSTTSATSSNSTISSTPFHPPPTPSTLPNTSTAFPSMFPNSNVNNLPNAMPFQTPPPQSHDNLLFGPPPPFFETDPFSFNQTPYQHIDGTNGLSFGGLDNASFSTHANSTAPLPSFSTHSTPFQPANNGSYGQNGFGMNGASGQSGGKLNGGGNNGNFGQNNNNFNQNNNQNNNNNNNGYGNNMNTSSFPSSFTPFTPHERKNNHNSFGNFGGYQ